MYRSKARQSRDSYPGRRNRIHARGVVDGDTAGFVSHWRRRHDRLLGGIAQVLKAHEDAPELKQMLRRLLSIDRQPLPGDPSTASDRRDD